MGKKIPIYLSTLTILASILPTVSASAVSETGPWSFDELTAAKNEIETEASTKCTDSLTRSACISQIMEDKGGIYYDGLWKFRFNQFTPLSMDFATGELGYYYNSTNEYRKINNKRPYLKDYLTKLVIVQVEQGYDNWASDLITDPNNSEHLRVLYNGTLAEGETSLLPYDQKATLTIEKPSFNPKYDKYLRALYVDTFSDGPEISTYDFSECAEGRKCDAWYDTKNPYLFFKDFSYTDGYNAGYSEGFDYGKLIGQSDGYYGGYDTGYGDGYNNGYNDGYVNGQNDGGQTSYEAGHTDGKTEGYNAGYEEGYSTGHNDGNQEGYSNGRTDGYSEGHQAGIAEGYQSGLSDGHQTGLSEGYQNGYTAGLEAGRAEGYQAGHTEGYEAGMNDGYSVGYTNGYEEGYNTDRGENATNNHTDENISNEYNDGPDNGNESTDLLANTNDVNNLNTDNPLSSTINLSPTIAGTTSTNTSTEGNNTIINTGPDPQAKSFTPNTGAPTAEEKSTEFPWWLGVISLASFGAFAWFFGPKRKNHKKITKNIKKV